MLMIKLTTRAVRSEIDTSSAPRWSRADVHLVDVRHRLGLGFIDSSSSSRRGSRCRFDKIHHLGQRHESRRFGRFGGVRDRGGIICHSVFGFRKAWEGSWSRKSFQNRSQTLTSLSWFRALSWELSTLIVGSVSIHFNSLFRPEMFSFFHLDDVS